MPKNVKMAACCRTLENRQEHQKPNQIGFFETYIWRHRFTFVAIFYQICTLCLWFNNNSVVAQNEDKKPFEQSPNGDKSVDMLFL